jgi:hypothetical protein
MEECAGVTVVVDLRVEAGRAGMAGRGAIADRGAEFIGSTRMLTHGGSALRLSDNR